MNDEKNSPKITILKKSSYNDAIIEQDWITLIDKHKLRYEIWTLLKIHKELNVTEISHLVKQSKSTVSRVLIRMEEDQLVKFRRAYKKKGEGEKIPPKFYRINEEIQEKIPIKDELDTKRDSLDIRQFYLCKIKNFRNAIYNFHKLIDLLTPLLNIFEDQLDDIESANQIYDNFLSDNNEPWFNILYFDNKSFNKFLDIRLEYLLKMEKLAREQELDTENAFAYLDASIPLKTIFELKKQMSLKKK
jgi:DNA-binding transcriptional regulator GbsR (MarR family)